MDEQTEVIAQWRGRAIEVLRDDTGRITLLRCPKCGNHVSIATTVHRVTETNGKVTVNPSLVCPYECGWHVTITDGICRG